MAEFFWKMQRKPWYFIFGVDVMPLSLKKPVVTLFSVKLQVMKDLRKQLKDAQKDVREMKLLLDMFKTLPKEQRDKAQLMAAEKKVSIVR